jgi:hypothetical protein
MIGVGLCGGGGRRITEPIYNKKKKKLELTQHHIRWVPENKPRKIFKKYTHSQPTTENQRY